VLTVGDTARTLRDRPLGKVLILVAALAAAFLVSRSCGSTQAEVSKEQAIAIAREQVSFQANHVIVRLVKQGLRQREFWLVGLAHRLEDGTLENATNVLVDGDTGQVASVRRASP
jgi:hypothetical protein